MIGLIYTNKQKTDGKFEMLFHISCKWWYAALRSLRSLRWQC